MYTSNSTYINYVHTMYFQFMKTIDNTTLTFTLINYNYTYASNDKSVPTLSLFTLLTIYDNHR